MIGSTAGKSRIKMVALLAYAAGVTGILANLFLITFYVMLGLQAGHQENGIPLGSASDLTGSLSTTLMIPVALALAGLLPQRRVLRLTQAAGLTAMALLNAWCES